MNANNKAQIPILASLSDDLLISAVAEIGSMLDTDLPKFKPGMDKTKYATRVMEKVEASAARFTEPEAKKCADKIVNRIKNESPDLWSIITGKFKMLRSILNFNYRKN